MSDRLHFRLALDGRSATWNPALTRAARVLVRIERADGVEEVRPSLNSGRVRVREGERILGIAAGEAE